MRIMENGNGGIIRNQEPYSEVLVFNTSTK